MKFLPSPLTFDWDSGNRGKNWRKHRVTDEESEEIFFDPDKQIVHDPFHSRHELRYVCLGRTRRGRLLFVVFTVRKTKVRVISARDLKRKERKSYEKKA